MASRLECLVVPPWLALGKDLIGFAWIGGGSLALESYGHLGLRA